MIILVVGMKDYWKRHFDLSTLSHCATCAFYDYAYLPHLKLGDWHRFILFVWPGCPRWGSSYFYSFWDLPTQIRILNVKYLQRHLNTLGITLQLVFFRTFTSTSQMMLRFSSSTPKSIFMKRKCSLLHQRYEKENNFSSLKIILIILGCLGFDMLGVRRCRWFRHFRLRNPRFKLRNAHQTSGSTM